MACSFANDPINDRQAEDDRTALQVAEDAQDWPRVATLVEAYDAVQVPAEHRAFLDACLFQRALVTVEEPGYRSLLIVTLEDAAGDVEAA